MNILNEVEIFNNQQRLILIKKLQNKIGILNNKKIAIFGLTFKSDTDDYRDAPSIDIIKKLQNQNVNINLYDPFGTDQFIAKYFQNSKRIYGYNSAYDAGKDVDAIMIITEWDEFKNLDFIKISEVMKGNLILDGRNILEPSMIRAAGLEYIGIANS